MNEPLTCSCQMKTDLENSADAFSFFKENYPLSSITNNPSNSQRIRLLEPI